MPWYYQIKKLPLRATLLRCAIARPLFTSPLACQRRLHPRLLAGLQVERVALDVLNDVFLQDLALETFQRALQALAFMELNFSQRKSPQIPTDCQNLSLAVAACIAIAGLFAVGAVE